MTTQETANRTKTPYFIEYVYPVDAYGHQSFYFQLVRTKDLGILCSNEKLDNIFIHCWMTGIAKDQVTIW